MSVGKVTHKDGVDVWWSRSIRQETLSLFTREPIAEGYTVTQMTLLSFLSISSHGTTSRSTIQLQRMMSRITAYMTIAEKPSVF